MLERVNDLEQEVTLLKRNGHSHDHRLDCHDTRLERLGGPPNLLGAP